jgi:hypothetical protein
MITGDGRSNETKLDMKRNAYIHRNLARTAQPAHHAHPGHSQWDERRVRASDTLLPSALVEETLGKGRGGAGRRG